MNSLHFWKYYYRHKWFIISSGASLVPILSPEEVGEMFNLDAKVVEWIKNEPADDKDPLLVLDFKDAFFNLGNYDANKAAVTNALVGLLFNFPHIFRNPKKFLIL